MSQLGRMERSYRDELKKNPNDADLAKQYKQFLRDRAEQELAIFRETVENYPTDSAARFEMARRMFMLGHFEESIGVFQQARNDPKYRAEATKLLGRAFLEAGFQDEAVETLQALIAEYPVKGDEKSIDMHYWYAMALEKKGDLPAALKNYSQVAQWNFNYRDVQARIKRLRGQNQPQTQPASTSGAPATT
jgi:tetratricopeptide (TPR) repeat protein